MNKKRKSGILCVLTAVMLAISMLPLWSFAEEPETVDDHHYLAFVSDAHADPDHLYEDVSSKVSVAMKGFPEEIDYISLLGDAAGDGKESPVFKISHLFGAFYETLKTEDWQLHLKNFSLIPSEHDLNAEIDSDAGFLKKEESEEVYRGITHDGITFCYCYGIGVDGMAAGGEVSMEAAKAFKHWVKNKDTTIPIVVLSHLPIQALCGDNPGASYWNEALNYAATGVEGITGKEDSHAIIRNVIFLSGHNHIKDETEYVFRAGTEMTVQADTTQAGSEGQTAENEAAADGERADGAPDGGDSGNTVSSIYYTAITPGYLCAGGNATLMDITEDTITFTKHNNGSEVSLGTDGVTGEILGSALTLKQFKKSDEGGPVITKQPENAEVSYPDGATFSVETADPDNVASYQWYMLDIEDQLFYLEGASAHTNTLIVPSTQRRNNALRFYCLITGKDGLKTVSRQAILDLDNRAENKPVLYVGEYAVEPGESLDLSSVDIGDGFKLGSGRVTFDSNASDITIENLDFDNAHTCCDLSVAPNVGLDLEYEDPDQEVYNVTFTGENRIMNTYYNYDYNVGGIPFDFYIVGDGPKPLVNFIGDGTLTITNGLNAVRIIGDLMIGIDITVNQNRPEYADGIVANNMLVSEGRKLDLTVNGFAFNANGNLFMKDAEVSILANTPHISQGTVTKSIVAASNTMSLENTKLDIRSITDQSVCGSAAGCNMLYSAGELFITKGSEVNCDIQLKGDGFFANSFSGVSAFNGDVEDSTLTVRLDSENCMNSRGLYAEEDFQFLNSKLTVDMRSAGIVYGAAAERDFNAEDSNVDVKAGSCTGEECYGLICENAVFKVTGKDNQMKFNAENGVAVGCVLDTERSDTPVGYKEDYASKNVYLRDDTACLVPEENVISLTSVPVIDKGRLRYASLETIYDVKDTSKPAETAVFGLAGSGAGSPFTDVEEGSYYYDAVNWAVNNTITNGTGDTTFSPDDTCTRAQVVTFLWRAAGCPELSGAENPFTDISEEAYYYKAVLWAVGNGITNGTTQTTFSPEEPCTRCQVATFLWRAAKEPAPAGTNNPFKDVDSGAYYYKAVLWAVNHTPQITNGISADTFGTNDPCTRAQIVTFLYRADS